jgi:transcriptional regulator with XRE-family HTH domain
MSPLSDVETMTTLGTMLRERRLEKGISLSQAAAATRIKLQHIEAMERDDFSGIAAAMYAKGFIRLYAGYLGLDPGPLVAEYLELHASLARTPCWTGETTVQERDTDPPRPAARWRIAADVLSPLGPWRRVVVGGLLGAGVAIALAVASRALNDAPQPEARPTLPEAPRAVVGDPPEPYLEDRVAAPP